MLSCSLESVELGLGYCKETIGQPQSGFEAVLQEEVLFVFMIQVDQLILLHTRAKYNQGKDPSESIYLSVWVFLQYCPFCVCCFINLTASDTFHIPFPEQAWTPSILMSRHSNFLILHLSTKIVITPLHNYIFSVMQTLSNSKN